MPKSGNNSGTAFKTSVEPSGLSGAKKPSQAKLRIIKAINQNEAPNLKF
jgi:hypothetical protein